jgi:phage regulator Rha-like protein
MKNNLVITKQDDVFTNSLLISEKLEVPHKVLFNTIERIVKKQCDSRAIVFEQKFIKSSFINKMGRTYPMYLLNEPAFSKLVMNLSGYEKAEVIQDMFIEAFFLMKRALLNQQNASWLESRDIGKQARLELSDTIKDFVDYASDQGSQNAKFYYSTITSMTYKALELIDKNKSTPIRDMLTSMELGFLMVAEKIAEKALIEGMDNKMHYKEIYYFAKDRLIEFSNSIPNVKRKELK